MQQKYKTIGYIILIISGYMIGQYPFIPSFNIWMINHIQHNIEVYDKCMSITLFIFSFVLLLSVWHNYWVKIVMIFINWGMLGNMIDELTDRATLLTFNEKLSLLFALITTSLLIWKRHKRLTTR